MIYDNLPSDIKHHIHSFVHKLKFKDVIYEIKYSVEHNYVEDKSYKSYSSFSELVVKHLNKETHYHYLPHLNNSHTNVLYVFSSKQSEYALNVVTPIAEKSLRDHVSKIIITEYYFRHDFKYNEYINKFKNTLVEILLISSFLFVITSILNHLIRFLNLN